MKSIIYEAFTYTWFFKLWLFLTSLSIYINFGKVQKVCVKESHCRKDSCLRQLIDDLRDEVEYSKQSIEMLRKNINTSNERDNHQACV
jgi:hypothetical protein